MARYDAGWGRGGGPRYGGYDYGAYGGGAYGGSGWDQIERAERSVSIYGPARYGLGPYHQRLRQRRRSDAELREEVEEALFYDTWVDAEAIGVEVKGGVVTLSGELPSYEEIRYATDDAWDVDGVLGVRSELRVREE
ncbi:MAG TPA: BON domain-containing protein [Longimicrobiaceae bacterium]|jgi:osmotically-inducible protein OsmY|nr:BON domain-containing protein [Longimicrobiaceae bacterium]